MGLPAMIDMLASAIIAMQAPKGYTSTATAISILGPPSIINLRDPISVPTIARNGTFSTSQEAASLEHTLPAVA